MGLGQSVESGVSTHRSALLYSQEDGDPLQTAFIPTALQTSDTFPDVRVVPGGSGTLKYE